jgi:hypothetical protein
MLETDLLRSIEPSLSALGARWHDGEVFDDPPLAVLRYAVRPTRVSRVPLLGRALGVVAIVRQPIDLAFDAPGLRTLLSRLGRAAAYRFPQRTGPEGGLALGLTAIVLTPEPIRPDDDGRLETALARPPAGRAVPVGLFRVNLGQECLALALRKSPRNAFPEPLAVAEALSAVLARHVPALPMD